MGTSGRVELFGFDIRTAQGHRVQRAEGSGERMQALEWKDSGKPAPPNKG